MPVNRVPFISLRWRLLAAFLAVSLGAVALVSGIAAASVRDNTARLLDRQRDQLREQIATALSAAFAAGRGSADTSTLAGLQALAAAQGAELDVVDTTGRHLTEPQHHGDATSPTAPAPTAPTTPSTTAPPTTRPPADPTRPPAEQTPRPTGPATSDHRSGTQQPTATGGGHHAATPTPTSNRTGRDAAVTSPTLVPAPVVVLVAATPTAPAATPSPPVIAPNTVPANAATDRVTVPIVADGNLVATAYLDLPTSDAAVAAARRGLLNAVMWAAVLAAALATVAAVLVSRRVSKPLLGLAAATRAFAAGDPDAEAKLRPAPGELGAVGRTFAAMAATLRRQEELRRGLIADVAHELRTPVTILRGQTEQLLDGIEVPSTARIVSLHDEVLRLERLTDDLAALSAADAAVLTLQRRPIDLAALTRQTIDAMRPTLAAAELDAETDIDDDLLLDADPGRLTQVATNLLANAAKFTPPHGRIEVELHRDATDAVLTVSDTGPGIPDDELPHVFDRFWRGRASGPASGSGVGLAVVQSIVSAHGGTVTAENNATGGARFTVRLPIGATPNARPHPRRVVKSRAMSATILVVEDEPKIRDLLRSYLERDGHVVLTAALGSQALTVARETHPDLVVLDLRLPDIPGEEVIRELRRDNSTPVLILTAKTATEDRIHCLELGADDYVTKPFSPREVALRVNAILRRSQPDNGAETTSYGRGQLVLDEAQRRVIAHGVATELTTTEWRLLVTLASAPGRVFSRYELVNAARGYEFDGYERVIDSHIRNLRHKIEADPHRPTIVETLIGAGYRLAITRDRAAATSPDR